MHLSGIEVSTMNSLGYRIIRANPEKFGFTDIPEVLNEKNPRIVLLSDAASISGLERNKWKLVEKCRRHGDCDEKNTEEKCIICNEYKSILRKCSLVDYDDQILLVCDVLRKDKELRESWKKRTRYLLVDEYQDINEAQCELIQLLTENQAEGLFAVGDDDQSIYSFRGGSPKYIKEFKKYFGNDFKIGKLSKSWRCPEHILLGAREVIDKFNKSSVPKPIPTFSEKIETNNKIVFYDMSSERDEASIVAYLASERIKTEKIIIIIPNINYLSSLKEALIKEDLDFKYKLSLRDEGLTRFTALADWIKNTDNNQKLRYLVDLIIKNHDELTRKYGAGENNLTTKREEASKFIASLLKDVEYGRSFYNVITSMSEKSEDNSFISDLLGTLNDLINLLKKDGSRRNSLPRFLQQCGLCVAPGKNPSGLLAEIEEWRNELTGSMRGKSYSPINIYNLRSSKGLEADVIFVVGLSDGLFPDSSENIEEQGRLFYVTMTRAKKELFLFSTRTRSTKITYKPESFQLEPSPFIAVIPDKHIEMEYRKPYKKR